MIASILIIGVVVPAALGGPAHAGGPGAHNTYSSQDEVESPRKLQSFSLNAPSSSSGASAFSAHGDTISDYLADIAFPDSVNSQMNDLYRDIRNVHAVMDAYSMYFSRMEGLKGFAAFFQGRSGFGIQRVKQDMQDYVQGRGGRIIPKLEVNGLAACEATKSIIPVWTGHADAANRFCLCQKELAVGNPPSTCPSTRRMPLATLHAMYDLHELMEYLAAKFKDVAEQVEPSTEYDVQRFLNNCLRQLGDLRAEAAVYIRQLMAGDLASTTLRVENNFENQYNVDYTNLYDTHNERATRTANGLYQYRANRWRSNFNNGHFNTDRITPNVDKFAYGPYNSSTGASSGSNSQIQPSAEQGFQDDFYRNLFNGDDEYATGNFKNKLFKNANRMSNYDAMNSEFISNNVFWNSVFNNNDDNIKAYNFANNFANDFNNNLLYNRNYNTNVKRPIP